MTRFAIDPPDDDAFDSDLRPNATCTDCGADYSKADTDPTTWCDACSDRRDAHTALLEIRFLAAKVLALDPSRIKDVA